MNIKEDMMITTLALQFLFAYARAVQRETDLTNKIVSFFVSSISSTSMYFFVFSWSFLGPKMSNSKRSSFFVH